MCGCSCESGKSHHRQSCCCDGHHHSHPVFWTREAKISWLESYLSGLEEEGKSVRERLAQLKDRA